MISHGLLVLLCYLTLCCAQQPEWSWACKNVTGMQEVDINKVVGAWYIIGNIHDHPRDEFLCPAVDIVRSDDKNYLELNTYDQDDTGKFILLFNSSVVMATTSKWINTDISKLSLLVVDLFNNGETLSISQCLHDFQEHVFTVILTKDWKNDMSPVIERLYAKGLTGDVQLYNMTKCSPLHHIQNLFNP